MGAQVAAGIYFYQIQTKDLFKTKKDAVFEVTARLTRSSQHSTTVIFDLDGTLIDSVEDIANAVNDVLSRAWFPTHDIEFYKQNIGGGINDLIQSPLPKTILLNPKHILNALIIIILII